MDESLQTFDEKEMLLNFASCFYVDNWGQIDISWDRYVPFATLYTQLFCSKSPLLGEIIMTKPDQATIFMLWSAVIGQYAETLKWTVGTGGKMIIDSVELPTDVNRYLKDADLILQGNRLVNEDFINKTFPFTNQPTRDFNVRIYGSSMSQMTHLHATIHKLIWRVSQMQID